jgi:outer membrane protein assembly factor BamB
VRGVLSCLNAADGKVLWRKDDFQGAVPRFFVSSSPVVADSLCVAQLGGQDNGVIAAYDLATGGEKWKWAGDSPAYASPVLMTVGGVKLIVAQTETRMVAIALADGKLVWETPFAVQGRGYNAATPIVDGQTLIYCGSGRGATAVKLEKSGDVFAAKELWKNPDNSVQFNTPVLKSGFLYGLSAGNDAFCLNAQDGKTAWSAPLSPPAPAEAATEAPPEGGKKRGGRGGGGGRGGYGSVVDAGSVLFALTPASELIAFQPDSKAYGELTRIKVSASPTHAYPVVSGNRIFVKDQDSVTLWTIQ